MFFDLVEFKVTTIEHDLLRLSIQKLQFLFRVCNINGLYCILAFDAFLLINNH